MRAAGVFGRKTGRLQGGEPSALIIRGNRLPFREIVGEVAIPAATRRTMHATIRMGAANLLQMRHIDSLS